MTGHSTFSEFAMNETADSRPASQLSSDETVTMTADERVATYLVEDQLADLTDAIGETGQNGIDTPGSSRVLVSISPERSIVENSGNRSSFAEFVQQVVNDGFESVFKEYGVRA
ncbi:hypothetical protein SAMN05192552_101636 [Natrinema hispanicum]|uniref:Uncharacterized protein n=2 Tax=Natrinema hispanicum TaxID=392421 RepID=A0A1I0IT36_9EURY|nr:hypothetical protein SAMN05192552_101636 [Natrinema hispanicum]SET99695.1 hypothetical protein SAMN04488694_12432 [Natrinema hispanicum]